MRKELVYNIPDLLRYERQLAVIGRSAQLKLRDARVAVVGVGGLGSNAAVQMTAMGIGHLLLIDRDTVDLTNINRQPLYDEQDVSRPKAKVAVEKLSKINSKIELIPIVGNFEENADMIKEVDVIVDGLDTLESRITLNALAVKFGIPYVFASVEGYFGNVATILPGRSACLACFMPLKQSNLRPCSYAVYPPAVFLASSIEVSEAVSLIINGYSPLAGKLLVFDFSSYDFDVVDLKKNPACPVCGDQVGQA